MRLRHIAFNRSAAGTRLIDAGHVGVVAGPPFGIAIDDAVDRRPVDGEATWLSAPGLVIPGKVEVLGHDQPELVARGRRRGFRRLPPRTGRSGPGRC